MLYNVILLFCDNTRRMCKKPFRLKLRQEPRVKHARLRHLPFSQRPDGECGVEAWDKADQGVLSQCLDHCDQGIDHNVTLIDLSDSQSEINFKQYCSISIIFKILSNRKRTCTCTLKHVKCMEYWKRNLKSSICARQWRYWEYFSSSRICPVRDSSIVTRGWTSTKWLHTSPTSWSSSVWSCSIVRSTFVISSSAFLISCGALVLINCTWSKGMAIYQ